MIISSRKSLFVGAAVIAAVAFAFYMLVFEARTIHEDTCAGVTRIASDAHKMKYLKSWLALRISDEEFMNEVRRSRFFERGDPRLHEFIDLDWTYLGFTPDFVSITFNVRDIGKGDFDASSIGSASIGQGRSAIIVRLNESKDFGLLWSPNELSRMRPIADDVFVYCGA